MTQQNACKVILCQLLPILAITLLFSGCGGGAAGGSSPGANNAKQDAPIENISSSSEQPSSMAPSSSSIAASSTPKLSSKSSNKPSSASSRSASNLDQFPPTAPTAFQVTAVFHDAVSLSWTPAVDNVAVVFYKIYRDQIQIDMIEASNDFYFDLDVAPSESYNYGISAGDAAGNWTPIKAITAQTLAAPPQSGNPNASSTQTFSQRSSARFASTTSASNSSRSATGNSNSSQSSVHTDTTLPTAPSSLNQTALFSTQVDLRWTAATDNIAVTSYRVYRDAVLITTLNANNLSYSDSTAVQNRTYTYSVGAGDAAGNWSPTRRSLVVTTPIAQTAVNVTLNWIRPTARENGNALPLSELRGYEIRYKLVSEDDYTPIIINDTSATSHLIPNLSGEYEFQIAAYDTNLLYSNFVTLSPH